MNPSMSKHLVLVIVCFAFAFIAASAKETSIAAASPETRQHVQALDPAAATQAWLASVPRSEREKSDAYFEGGYWLILWNFLMAAAISIFLLASRISAWLRDFAERATRFTTLQVILYAILFVLLTYLLEFPLNVYEHFFREHAYGLATQNFA